MNTSKGGSHQPKDGDDVHQSISFLNLQGQRGQDVYCISSNITLIVDKSLNCAIVIN